MTTPSPLLERLASYPQGTDLAIEQADAHGRPLLRATYADLRARSARVAASLLDGRASLGGAPVAFLCEPSITYVEAFLGILRAGGLAVPLSPHHAPPELRHVLDDAHPERVLVTASLAPRLAALVPPDRLRSTEDARAAAPTHDAPHVPDAPALMLYTSGTTGKPKGVVTSHAALAATCRSLEEAWGWRRDDRLLHVLPLHHTHGVVVALLGALWAGATTRFAPFDAAGTWDALGDASVFMAVPTIYAKLLAAHDAAGPEARARQRALAARPRLYTSGSAALAASLHAEFRAATGQLILERYGMTEIGMALSNPLAGERIPGAVGHPLPGVQVDVVDELGRPVGDGEPGELRVRSPQMFSGYHRDPENTARSFDELGRFRTGDTGVRDTAGVFRLLGRTSVDVLKSGGYKLSALEIEAVLREHPAIADVAVVGTPDPTWGDRVTACVTVRPGATLSLGDLRVWAKERLAPYKAPRALALMPTLPRNAMGKLQKPELVAGLRSGRWSLEEA